MKVNNKIESVKVALKQDPYTIKIGWDTLPRLGTELKKLKMGRDAVVITSNVIYRLHGKALTRSLTTAGFNVKVFQVADGEQSKSSECAMKLLEQIARYDVFKQMFVVAFGGGVIGDLAGFVAATYKRGVPYVQIPTTFLAQIDSSIGGKVAIDLPVGKNLVGAFYQPKLVFSDVKLLKTLDKRQIRNGFAEAVKYGIIYDLKFFDLFDEDFQKIFNFDPALMTKVVKRCSEIKRDVVLADEKETKGIRTILNFGHTVGHAIEAAGRFSVYQHGEAIALGMRIAMDISLELKLCSQLSVRRVNQLLTQIGLPEKIEKLQLRNILHLMRHDKKFIAGKNRFVLCRQIGKVKVVEGVSPDVIKKSIQKFL